MITVLDKTITLERSIAAIQMVAGESGQRRIGTLLRLAEGARLRLCGEGFSDRTVCVQSDGVDYIVLLDRVVA